MTNVTTTPQEEKTPSTTTTSPLYVLHTPRGSFRSFPTLVTAQHQGILKDIHMVSSPNLLEQDIPKKSPTGKAPLLEIKGGGPSSSSGEHGVLVGSHAIAKYMSSLGSGSGGGGETTTATHSHKLLYHGHTPFQQAQIDGWMEFTLQELDIPCTVWTYPTMGYMSFHETADKKAQDDLAKGFQVLNQALENQSYLIGTTYPTLADIVVFSSLYYPLIFKILPQEYAESPPHMFVDSFPHVIRWYHQCMDQPAFQSIFQNPRHTVVVVPEG